MSPAHPPSQIQTYLIQEGEGAGAVELARSDWDPPPPKISQAPPHTPPT